MPIMWSTGVGVDVMQPLACPDDRRACDVHGACAGGDARAVLLYETAGIEEGTLKVSKMAGWMKEG